MVVIQLELFWDWHAFIIFACSLAEKQPVDCRKGRLNSILGGVVKALLALEPFLKTIREIFKVAEVEGFLFPVDHEMDRS